MKSCVNVYYIYIYNTMLRVAPSEVVFFSITIRCKVCIPSPFVTSAGLSKNSIYKGP